MEEITVEGNIDKMKSQPSEKPESIIKSEETNGNVSGSDLNDVKELTKSKNSSVIEEINGSSDSNSLSSTDNVSEKTTSKENGYSNSDEAIDALMAAASTVTTKSLDEVDISVTSPKNSVNVCDHNNDDVSESVTENEIKVDDDLNVTVASKSVTKDEIKINDDIKTTTTLKSANVSKENTCEVKINSCKPKEIENSTDKCVQNDGNQEKGSSSTEEEMEVDINNSDQSQLDEISNRKRKIEEPADAPQPKKPMVTINTIQNNVKNTSSPTPSAAKENEERPKVTVIELGNSNLKLSEILKLDKGPSNNLSRPPNNSTITISSAKTMPRILSKVPITNSQSILINKTRSPSQTILGSMPPILHPPQKNISQMVSNVTSKSQPLTQPLPQPLPQSLPQPMSIAKILANKNVPYTANANPNQKLQDIIPEVPTVEVIDEKEEYNKLVWEDSNIFPIIRPGRFLPPSPNETMSIAMCNERLIECASKVTPFLLRYPLIPKVDEYVFKKRSVEEPSPQPYRPGGHLSVIDQTYFKNSVGTFFMEIGQRLVSEWVQKDLVRSRKRKMEKEGETDAGVKSLQAMVSMYDQLKAINSPFHFPLRKCDRCKFKTESTIVMQSHFQTPHIFPGTYKYSCTYCDYDSRDSSAISLHMKMYHNVTGIVDPIPFFHHCVLCLYNTDKKKRLYSHMAKCNKNFKLSHNLAPTTDYSYPAKSFPPTWMHGPGFQRSLSSMAMKGARFAAPVMRVQGLPASGYKPIQSVTQPRMRPISMMDRPVLGSAPRPVNAVAIQDPKSKLYKLISAGNNNQGSIISSSVSRQPRPPSLPLQNFNSSAYNNKSPITIIKNNTTSNQPSRMQTSKSIMQKPSITLTPVNPSQPNPSKVKGTTRLTSNGLQSITVPFKGGKGSHTFVICEICDGYIRDLDQLRAHMQWMHKVKIHPKMIYNRPPLNCQKCQYRFFTDQGLERHLLGIHGLVTSNMQESANKGQDAGRCSACGKTFQSKLLLHIAKTHKISLKPAHLSYKCTVCAATFTLYKLFENHVYSKHTVQGNSKASTPTPKPVPYSKPGPAFSKKLAVASSNSTSLTPIPKPAKTLPTCPKCEQSVTNIERHWADCHQRPFSVKLCHIEQCHKCLSEFDGFVVIHTEYFDSDDD